MVDERKARRGRRKVSTSHCSPTWAGRTGETKPLRRDESILMRLKGYRRFIETAACGAAAPAPVLHKRCKMTTVCRINDATPPLLLHQSDTEGQKHSGAGGWTTSECHSSQWDIPTRGKRGTVPFQAGEDICSQAHSSLTPYVSRSGAPAAVMSAPKQTSCFSVTPRVPRGRKHVRGRLFSTKPERNQAAGSSFPARAAPRCSFAGVRLKSRVMMRVW